MILPFDLAVSQFIYTLRTPGLTKTMFFITSLGSEYVFSVLFIILAIIVWKKHRSEGLLFPILASLSLPINLLLKSALARPRPTLSPLLYEPTASFPSGHAMNSLVFYFTLVFLVYRLTKNKQLTLICSVIALSLSLLIGFSRIYLGVHYTTDVLGGYFFGLIWFATCLLLTKLLHL
jgi:undecaprenyl-diphosphatase